MKWILIALVLAVALIAAGVVITGGEGGGSAVSASPEAVRLCEEGTDDYHAFRLRDAVDKLGRALELDPLLAEASIARTFAFHRLGQTEEFKAELARADSLTGLIEDDRRRMLAELRLASVWGTRFHVMRDSLLERLGREMPENLYVLEARAMAEVREGDEEAQERAWRKVLEVDPNHATSYNMLGYLKLHQGEYDQAIEYMQKYAFLAPDQANPHDSLGEVLMVLGRYEEAEEAFRRSVKMQPDFYHSLINLGKSYLARGRLDDGMKILGKVREEVVGSELAKRIDRELVNVFLIAGLEEELDRATAAFIANYPEDGTSCFYRGIRLAHRDRFDAAAAVMDSCLTEWRDHENYADNEKHQRSVRVASKTFDALLAEAAGEPAAAARLWRDVLDTVRDERAYHEQWFERYSLAAALHRAGDHAAALEEIEPILDVNPRLFGFLELAVRCYLEEDRLEDARRALNQLQWCVDRADPDYPYRANAAALQERVADAEVDS